MEPFVSFVIAYLIGSISSAIVVCKLFGLPDPRNAGSRNPGATNVLRLSGKFPAVLTLVGDIAKGTLPVIAASVVTQHPVAIAGAALGSFLGHLYPVYFGFKGGKGVATAIGVYLGINIFVCLGVVAVWLGIAIFTRYSSLSSLMAMFSAPILLWYLESDFSLIVITGAIFALSVYRHASNIQRLLAGKENKITLTKS